jgi:hypothetical protein
MQKAKGKRPSSMPIFRTFAMLLALVPVAAGAEGAKLRTTTGKALEGDLVSISEKELVLRGKDGPATVPMKEVLDLNLQSASTPTEAKYTDVELTDGTLLHCVQLAIKKDKVEVKLAGGPEIKLPLAVVNYILNNAQEAQVRDEWPKLQAKRGNNDLLAIKDSEGAVNSLSGTFGEGDEAGTAIGFETASGTKTKVALTRVHGMSFLRKLSPDMPSAVCKVHDTSKNALAALKVTFDGNTFKVTTAAGVEVTYPRELLARVDFSSGKLAYLSDLEPIRVVERPTSGDKDDWVDHYRRDKSFNDDPQIRIGKEKYAKGLALHAFTDLVYDIGGEYKEFKAFLGFDPNIKRLSSSPVKILIEGDGRELYTAAVKPPDAKDLKALQAPQALTLNVQNVKRLRIVVSSSGLFDLGDYLNLADAKVSK